MEYKKKNGNQQAIKLPIIRPRINVARRSFFLAIRFFSFSASCCGVNLGPPPIRSVFVFVLFTAEFAAIAASDVGPPDEFLF